MFSVISIRDPKAKFTRASKPKCRTGCRTCKARRVKCDEAKPACRRCTSTGRKCDGYNIVTSAPPNPPNTPLKKLPIPRNGQWLPLVRLMIADIDGDPLERRYYHHFRAATERGISIHVCDSSGFWTKIAPQLSHHSPAVKHAMIALGGALKLCKDAEDGHGEKDLAVRSRLMSPEQRHEVDTFVAAQYSQSIAKLREIINSNSDEKIEATLVCCLLFVCLDKLLSRLHGAVGHLRNGLRILEANFDLDAALRLSRTSADDDKATRNGWLSKRELRELIIHFRRFETSAAIYFPDVTPAISLGLYHRASHEGGTARIQKPCRRLVEAHAAMAAFFNDCFAQVANLRHRQAIGDEAFMKDPENELATRYLLRTGNKTLEMYRDFLRSRNAPTPGGPEVPSASIDMVGGLCGHVSLRRITHLYFDAGPKDLAAVDAELEPMYQEILLHTKRAMDGGLFKNTTITLDMGVLPPLYFVYAYSGDALTKSMVMDLLEKVQRSEGLWDGKKIKLAMRDVHRLASVPGEPVTRIPDPLTGYGSISCLFNVCPDGGQLGVGTVAAAAQRADDVHA